MESDESQNPREDEDNGDPEFKGILVSQGTELTLHGFSIRISEEGIQTSGGGVSLRRDMCSPWLEVALDHLLEARDANVDLVEAHEADVDVAEPLHREFKSGMQAIVASAVALDAFYAAVKDRIDIPIDQIRAWSENRTARWKQVREVFRRAFGVPQEKVEELGNILQETFKFRGWAVHPRAEKKKPVRHPQIARGVEWRYMAFRYKNAEPVVRSTLSIVTNLIRQPRDNSETLRDYCESLLTNLEPLTDRWAENYPDHNL